VPEPEQPLDLLALDGRGQGGHILGGEISEVVAKAVE
jgi:hypothetical protein